jgi:uncharacterized protein (TIGR02001 family)
VIGAVRFVLTLLAAAAALCVPAAAHAQLAGSISIESDYRIRGRSISDERPVASARIGYDHSSGAYADGSASVFKSDDDGVQFLGYQVDAGFATRLGPLWTVDVGVAHDHFRSPYPGGFHYRRSEAYVGVTHGPLSAYVFASPSYARLKSATLYEQLEATIAPAPQWRLNAHAGALELLDSDAPFSSIYDWRVGVSREIGSFELHTALSGDIPGHAAHRLGIRAKTVLTAGASYSF